MHRRGDGTIESGVNVPGFPAIAKERLHCAVVFLRTLCEAPRKTLTDDENNVASKSCYNVVFSNL